MLLIALFFKLLIAHCIADYPLQGEFIAKAKNHLEPIPGISPVIILFTHAAIHAGAVWYVTGYGSLAFLEFAFHTTIDYLKCDKQISFAQDQFLHILCKIIYCFIIAVAQATH